MGARTGLRALLQRTVGGARRLGGFVAYTLRRFDGGNCFQTASALTYTSLLAIVPLLTLGFGVLSAFPAFETLQGRAERTILSNLVPAAGDAFLNTVQTFLHNAGQMTAVGVVGLAVTSLLTLSTIESSFKAIWRVAEPRPLIMRFLSFWAILTMAPLLFGASLSLSSYVYAVLETVSHDVGVANPATMLGGVLVPVTLEVLGFTLLYVVIPSRPVAWQDAAIGGAVAAVLLDIWKGAFAWYFTSFPAYQTIYGALAAIPTFLFWLYGVWTTMLYGAVITAALPEWRAGYMSTATDEDSFRPVDRLAVALALLRELQDASRHGIGVRRSALVGCAPADAILVDDTLHRLNAARWAARTSSGAWVATRDLGEATLYDLMCSLGIGLSGMPASLGRAAADWQQRLAALLTATEGAERDILSLPVKEVLTVREGDDDAATLRMADKRRL